MDQAALMELGKQLIVLISPIIASGALSKVGEDATDRVTTLARRAKDMLQYHLGNDEDAADDLHRYIRQPTSEARQHLVAEQIATHIADADALAELRTLVDELRKATGAAAPVHNRTFTICDQAQVGPVNQGDVHGNLTIGTITFNAPAPASTGSGGGADSFAGYRAGLHTLLERLGTAHPRHNEARTYEQRLCENIAFAEREGDTETRRAERAAVITQLNALTQATLGETFNALCGDGTTRNT